jgi:hypothetical protein
MESIRVTMYWSSGQEARLDAMRASLCEALKRVNLLGKETVFVRDDYVQHEEYAARYRICGTPSMRINGLDVEQDLMMYEKPGLWLRKYMQAGQEIPGPTVPAIVDAIIHALAWQRRR